MILFFEMVAHCDTPDTTTQSLLAECVILMYNVRHMDCGFTGSSGYFRILLELLSEGCFFRVMLDAKFFSS